MIRIKADLAKNMRTARERTRRSLQRIPEGTSPRSSARMSALGAALAMGIATVASADPEAAGMIADAGAILTGSAEGDSAAARAQLVSLADAGHAPAAMALARAFYTGDQLGHDVATALDWWQRAADLGDTDAAYNAGLLLLRQADRSAEAFHWLRIAARRDDALACFALGTALAESGDPSNYPEAMRWLECAARHGYPPAQFNLARLLARGTPTAQQVDQARTWLLAAAPTFAPAAQALSDLAPPTPAVQRQEVERPIHDKSWVANQPPDNYTVQVAAGRDGPVLAALLERLILDRDAAWFLHRPNTAEPYTAVVGSYSNYADAARSLSSLPRVFGDNGPWIRRFASLHSELNASADAAPDTLPAE